MIKIKTLNHHFQNTQMEIRCIDGQCFKKLPVNGFKWVKEDDLSNFNWSFTKKL